MRLLKKWKRKSLYQKSLISFTVVLIFFGILIVSYVYKTAVIYERNLVDNYISYLATSGKLTDEIDDNLFKISEFEQKNAKITDGVKKLYKSENLKIKKNSKDSKDDVFAYDLYNGDKLISTVSLKKTDSYTRMAILTIDEWEVVDTKTYFDEGVYAYEINIPEDYHLYINDKEVKESYITSSGDVSGLEELTKYVKISPSKTYKINNLVYEPTIKITDSDNKNVNFKVEDNKISISKEFKKVDYANLKSNLKSDFDVLKFAEDWSLYLSKDLSGSNYGLYNIANYLIKDSKKYQFAYNWAHDIDITFISSHRLDNPVFSNEVVDDCIIYNENAFSCHVGLDKNMIVSGKKQVDKMNDRFYFIYYENEYKMVDSIANNKYLEK